MSIHITMDSVQLMEEFRTNAKSSVHCNDVSVTQSFEVELQQEAQLMLTTGSTRL